MEQQKSTQSNNDMDKDNDQGYVLNQSWQQFKDYWDTQSARNGAIAGAVGGVIAGIIASIIIAIFLWCLKQF